MAAKSKSALRKARKRTKEWHKKHPEYARDWHLRRHYGITSVAYEAMLQGQEGRCAGCKLEKKRLHVDHDHATGKVRGLLCGECNRALGLVADDVIRLQQLIEYLKESR